jgi:hypothetical protein
LLGVRLKKRRRTDLKGQGTALQMELFADMVRPSQMHFKELRRASGDRLLNPEEYAHLWIIKGLNKTR